MVSIHGPLGYGPSTLPLRHSAINTEEQWLSVAISATSGHVWWNKPKSICQKWDSNPRPQKWTATWTQRLRPLGHPDPILNQNKCLHSLSGVGFTGPCARVGQLVNYRVFFFTGPPWIRLCSNPFIKSHTLTFFLGFTTMPDLGRTSKKKHPVSMAV